MKNFAAVLILGLLAGCSDTVTNRYETRADAEADRLFDRGWLPIFIPPSSRTIVTSNDLDLNTSTGSFSFSPDDYVDFTSRLHKINEQDIPQNAEQLKYWEKGYNPFYYEYYNSRWTFLIHKHKGLCRYWLESIKL